MILIAPDKFKGTLSAKEAATIMADGLNGYSCLMAPMADGGEGTAVALASRDPEDWDEFDGYYVHKPTRTAAIDSSAWIGLRQAAGMGGVMLATSAPLGLKVRDILNGGCEKVIIGIGGTGTCDAGAGFLKALGADNLNRYADRIIGLCDVSVPLISDTGGIDALSFAPQKGATQADLPILRRLLEQAQKQWSNGRTSEFDGAGGGLGFAIASAIGAKCYKGAEYVLGSMAIDWANVDAAITGEGCIDEQTLAGKVVSAVCEAALGRGIPAIAIGGRVKDGAAYMRRPGLTIISAERHKRSDTLTPAEAASRLRATMTDVRAIVKAAVSP